MRLERRSARQSWPLLLGILLCLSSGLATMSRADDDSRTEKRIVIVPDDRLDVEIWLDKRHRPTYRVGDNIRIFFRTNKDAYVYLFDFTTDGHIYRLFPNRYDRDNFVRGNRVYSVPAEGYELEVAGPPGIERVKVWATTKRDFRLRHRGGTPYTELKKEQQERLVQRIIIQPEKERATASVEFRVVGRGVVAPLPPDHHDGGYGSLHLDGEFVRRAYRDILDRRPSRTELRRALRRRLYRRNPAHLVQDLLESDEYYVRSLYRTLLGRPADPSGLSYYLDRLRSGRMDRDDVARHILQSSEYADRIY